MYREPSAGATLEPTMICRAALRRRHLLAVEFRKGALHRIAKSDAFEDRFMLMSECNAFGRRFRQMFGQRAMLVSFRRLRTYRRIRVVRLVPEPP